MQRKIILDFNKKENYVIHINKLKEDLNKGIKLLKVHYCLKFEQKPWLAPYIELNTNQRKLATNNFDKDFFKLMNNSIFGKQWKMLEIELITK